MAEPHRDGDEPIEGDPTAPMDRVEPVDPGPEIDDEPGDERTIIDERPPAPAWSGRAGVPEPPTEYLRGGVPYQQAPPQAQPRTWWTPILLGLLALGLVGVVVLAAWLLGRSAKPEPTKPPVVTTAGPIPTTGAPTQPPSPTPTASPTAQSVQVPEGLVGMTQDEATAALGQVGLRFQLQFENSDQPEGIVISTDPDSGEVVPAQSRVTLVISLGPQQEPTPEPTPTP